jgi:hypothetical protein
MLTRVLALPALLLGLALAEPAIAQQERASSAGRRLRLKTRLLRHTGRKMPLVGARAFVNLDAMS